MRRGYAMKKTAFALACLALAAALALSDTITMKDGSFFIGRVVRYAEGVYYLDSDRGEGRTIPAQEVKQIEFSSESQRRPSWQQRGEDNACGDSSDRPIKPPMECGWAKTALVAKAATMKLDGITSARISMAGKLVKFAFQARSDIKQIGEDLYSAHIDDGWEVCSSVSFSKEGVEFMERVPDRRRRCEQSLAAKYTCYGIILNEDMKRDISKNPWEVGDIFLVGKTAKKVMGGESSISW